MILRMNYKGKKPENSLSLIYKNIFMKSLLTVISIFMFLGVQAQSTHPTIDTVEVSYMTFSTSGSLVNVLPEPIISLKTLTAVSKVHCKIINPSDSSVVYSVFYSVNASPLLDSSGRPLFLMNGLNVQILSLSPIELKDYIYQIQTEDDQGNLTVPYVYERIVQ